MFGKLGLFTIFLTAPVITVQVNILCTTDKYRTECQKLDEKSDIECIVAEDEITCIEHVSRGKATFSSVTAAAAFLGMAKPNIVMHAAFQHKKESNPYKYQTALVSNRNIKGGLSGLRNVSYCHPGFDATDIDPLRLIEFERELLIKNDIDIYSNDAAPIVENHIKAIHDFFGPSCRPGRWVPDTEFDETLKKRYSRLLVLCNTTNSGNALSQALNCALNNDNPAIALTTIFTITHEVQKEMSAFTICRNGSMSNAYLNPCEWSNLSNEIIVGNNNSGKHVPNKLRNWFSESMIAIELSYEVAEAEKILLKKVLFPNPFENYKITFKDLDFRILDTSEFRQNLTTPQSTIVRWCTISSNEQDKCDMWSKANLYNGIQPTLICIQRNNMTECINAIQENNADVVRIAADFGYYAKLAGLEAIAFPKTELEELVHTLLIVRPNITKIENLRRQKGCFNRNRSAEWLSFVNITENLALEYSEEFEYGLCKSNTTKGTTCSRLSENQYDDNQGALDCLRRDGNFAVITKTDNLELPENVTIMCRNGSLTQNLGLNVDEDCYLSTTPADVIVARHNDKKNINLKVMLGEADERFGRNSKYPFKLFGEFNDISNLLFKNSTLGLDFPNSENRWIKKYRHLFQPVNSKKKEKSGVKQMSSLMILAIISVILTWLVK